MGINGHLTKQLNELSLQMTQGDWLDEIKINPKKKMFRNVIK